jgi:hypothetical protein
MFMHRQCWARTSGDTAQRRCQHCALSWNNKTTPSNARPASQDTIRQQRHLISLLRYTGLPERTACTPHRACQSVRFGPVRHASGQTGSDWLKAIRLDN